MNSLADNLENVNFDAIREAHTPTPEARKPYIVEHNHVWTVWNADGTFSSEHSNRDAADLALYILNLPDISDLSYCDFIPLRRIGRLPVGRARYLARRQGHDLQLVDAIRGRDGLYVATCTHCRKTVFILPSMEIVGLAIRTKCNHDLSKGRGVIQ